MDVSANQTVIEPIRRVNSVARAKGCRVIYIAHRYSPDLREGGNPVSVNQMRSVSLKYYREMPWCLKRPT